MTQSSNKNSAKKIGQTNSNFWTIFLLILTLKDKIYLLKQCMSSLCVMTLPIWRLSEVNFSFGENTMFFTNNLSFSLLIVSILLLSNFRVTCTSVTTGTTLLSLIFLLYWIVSSAVSWGEKRINKKDHLQDYIEAWRNPLVWFSWTSLIFGYFNQDNILCNLELSWSWGKAKVNDKRTWLRLSYGQDFYCR